jgi:hypothetical protein
VRKNKQKQKEKEREAEYKPKSQIVKVKFSKIQKKREIKELQ